MQYSDANVNQSCEWERFNPTFWLTYAKLYEKFIVSSRKQTHIGFFRMDFSSIQLGASNTDYYVASMENNTDFIYSIQ